MEKEKININIDQFDNEITIRHGKALDPEVPQSLLIEGTIDAPVEYIVKREPKEIITHILVDMDEKKIVLTHGERNEFKTVITGQMIHSKAYKLLSLGSEWNSTEDLARVLRKLRRHFPKIEDCTALVSAIRNHKASIEQNTDKSKDDRGNRKNLSERSVKSTIPHDFTLTMPIFKDTEAVNFKVEIILDVRGSSISITLDSIEAEEIAVEMIEKSIYEQIDKVPKSYPVFYK